MVVQEDEYTRGRKGDSFALHAKLNDSPRQRLHDLPHVNIDEPLCSIYTGLGYRIFHSRINHSYNRPSIAIVRNIKVIFE